MVVPVTRAPEWDIGMIAIANVVIFFAVLALILSGRDQCSGALDLASKAPGNPGAGFPGTS